MVPFSSPNLSMRVKEEVCTYLVRWYCTLHPKGNIEDVLIRGRPGVNSVLLKSSLEEYPLHSRLFLCLISLSLQARQN